MGKRVMNGLEIAFELIAIIVLMSSPIVDMSTGYAGPYYKNEFSEIIVLVIFVLFWGANLVSCGLSIFENDNTRDSFGHIVLPCILFLSGVYELLADSAISLIHGRLFLLSSFCMVLTAFIKRSRLVVKKLLFCQWHLVLMHL